MTHDELVTYFLAKNSAIFPLDPGWASMLDKAEAAAGRSFAPAHRALMCAVGAIDIAPMEFADPNPAITVGYYPKLVKLGEDWGMPPDAMPIALDNGEMFVAFPDGHVAVITPAGLTGEKWPNFAEFLGEFLEAG